MKYIFIVFSLLILFLSCSRDNSDIEIELPTNTGENIQMVVGGELFALSLYDNSTAKAFLAMLPMVINMGDMNGNEKYYDLPNSLPTATVRPVTIRNGDLMLYGSRTLVLFYETFSSSYSYTRVGRVNDYSKLKMVLGDGNVEVKFEQTPKTTQYTLTYDTNGATSGSAPVNLTVDAAATISLNNGAGFNRVGYTFVGWNTNASGTGIDYLAEESYKINSNTTLYAKWSVVKNSNTMKVTVGNSIFTATLASSLSATAFKAMLPLTLNMSDFNSNEKVCSLSSSLVTAASNPGNIRTGDIMLYGSSSLVVFYETFSTLYSYTPIGKIDDIAGFKTALGTGDVTIKFELE